MYYHTFRSPWGNIVLVGDEEGISELFIDNNTKAFIIKDEWEKNESFFSDAQKQLEAYALGGKNCFNVKLNPKGTEYQKAVWKALIEIPYGETRSYKDIAIAMGNPNASRAVGLANNRNPIPILIPCHRVLGTSGKLTGYAYGLEVKRKLLLLESRGRGLF